jgi:nitronate monooxygenase
MLRTRLCELLNIEAPILGAPMGPEISSLELAAAVSTAGGLGMISFGGYPPPALRERIGRLRKLTVWGERSSRRAAVAVRRS